ncbi:GNAT family N-acetyltransferase [Deinococcus metallilatus]|uniref:GNAT family N-acetyltransferase n=1 Tax=Deinococcus metallilatus TaxID=1211322 RepID=A0AAJ5F5I4_9DEIO|nr:GNAT family N-acetyltransferase [Deinococcus metallilatus]MBB5295323.1 ribosomal protein S18 acetylase RimI-like enzyme [Deinococcus metallilatus]QBY08523.1 GNAT family N-acetyltransferase [Deinococcus metallilatus]RXJ11033.1 GNAT family N-acetyltransferase [Deinococcus metallilatus]TLK21589.1 GNAT family N-acetyltransferase [Deinococcus metallilatus]GMA15098.1 N-acetyltransferase [Deinococcus metallilatus]
MPADESLTLRPVRRTDAGALAQVAYATGFFGESARRFFPSRALFAALWVTPYLTPGAGGLGFVAERGGQVVGYILGSVDQRRYALALAAQVPGLLWRLLTGRLPGALASLRYLLRAARFGLPAPPTSRYPAHLHLNLLPEARGLGAGGALLDAFLAELRSRHVPGVQLSTTRRNVAAVHLYVRRGFREWVSRRTSLWKPWSGQEEEHLIMVLDLTREAP